MTYRLTITAQPGGTTNPSPGAYDIPANQQVSVTALPASGYQFTYWNTYPSWSENPATWPMVEPITIYPNFAQTTPPPTNSFPAGAVKTAGVTIKVQPAGVPMTLELWMSSDGTTVSARSGLIPFTSTNVNQVVTLPITMPMTPGVYHCYLDLFQGSSPAGYYTAGDITVTGVTPPTGMRKVCVFYYSGISTSIITRLIATKPKYVVFDIGAWPSLSNSELARLQAAGVIACAYIPAGGCRGFIYDAGDTTNKSPAGLDAIIDQAAAKGFRGIFFDEGGVYSPWSSTVFNSARLMASRYLQSPGLADGGYWNGYHIWPVAGRPDYNQVSAAAWTGLTVERYAAYAKSKGLFVAINCGVVDIHGEPQLLDPNMFTSPSIDAILSSEYFTPSERGSYGLAPYGPEQTAPGKCWVLAYAGVFDANTTKTAIQNGFGAAYCCESMATLSSNYEAYMAQIPMEA